MFVSSKFSQLLPSFVSEFVFLMLPLLLACDERFDLIQLILGQSILALTLMLFSCGSPKSNKNGKDKKTVEEPQPITESYIKTSLLIFRGFLQISTVVCILAIDFPAFPRRFGKTETFGYSPMDLGVGGYVFSSGLVAGRKLFSKNVSLWESSKGTFVVLLIGIGRMLVTKLIGYQVRLCCCLSVHSISEKIRGKKV